MSTSSPHSCTYCFRHRSAFELPKLPPFYPSNIDIALSLFRMPTAADNRPLLRRKNSAMVTHLKDKRIVDRFAWFATHTDFVVELTDG